MAFENYKKQGGVGGVRCSAHRVVSQREGGAAEDRTFGSG